MIRVVVIDDDIASIGLLAELLEESGMAEVVGRFTNPFDALDKLDGLNADVVFLDNTLPKISGMAFAYRLLKLNRRIGIVFVSEHGKDAVDAFEAGAIDYLLKPVTADRLEKTLLITAERIGQYKTNG